jgi:hypothetical protein
MTNDFDCTNSCERNYDKENFNYLLKAKHRICHSPARIFFKKRGYSNFKVHSVIKLITTFDRSDNWNVLKYTFA